MAPFAVVKLLLLDLCPTLGMAYRESAPDVSFGTAAYSLLLTADGQTESLGPALTLACLNPPRPPPTLLSSAERARL